MRNTFNLFRKYTALCLIVAGLILAPLSSVQASVAADFISSIVFGAVEAQAVPPAVPTGDNVAQVKETCIHVFHVCALPSLDNMALMILRSVVENLSTETVKYINSGFKDRENGSGFPLDLEKTFINAGDAVAGMVIDQAVGANGSLCEPFKVQLNIALRSNANINSQKSSDDFVGTCPLTSIVKNGEAGINNFLSGDFINEGGWDTWYAMTQDPLGNPYSSLFTIQADIDSRQAKVVGLQKEQLGWAKGFLSSQDCIKKSPVDDTQCVEWGPVKTPGSVLESQLQKVLGSQVDQLNVASNFNQIVTALVGQLEKLVISEAQGLFSDANKDYEYDSSNSTGASGIKPAALCTVSSRSVLVGEPVTWTAAAATVSDSTTYQWSGEEIPSDATNKTVTVSYTTDGSKTAYVTITQTTPNQTVPKSNTITCPVSVKVSKYVPLTFSCKADPVNLTVGQIGTWTMQISGGSGRLKFVDIDEKVSFGLDKSKGGAGRYQSYNPPAYFTPTLGLPDNSDDSWIFRGNPLPITRNNYEVIEIVVKIPYISNGEKRFKLDAVADMDPNVPILYDSTCQDSIGVTP